MSGHPHDIENRVNWRRLILDAAATLVLIAWPNRWGGWPASLGLAAVWFYVVIHWAPWEPTCVDHDEVLRHDKQAERWVCPRCDEAGAEA